jgi:peptide deformylase
MPFLQWPDKRLKSRSDEVEAITNATRAIWERMLDAMYAMPGLGLAAPQLGVMQRLAVVDCSGSKDPVRLANPVLLEASVEFHEHEEGSPCLPGVYAKVKRPSEVRVRYLDESGETVERSFDRLWSTSVQHQIDHLNGKLFFDRLSPVKRKMLLARHAKLQKRRN